MMSYKFARVWGIASTPSGVILTCQNHGIWQMITFHMAIDILVVAAHTGCLIVIEHDWTKYEKHMAVASNFLLLSK